MESIVIKEFPMVSVILNTRNRCNLLHRSIQSALNQTYKDFELIVVDGASEDQTKAVVEVYIGKDSRVRYLYVEENKSGAYCINLGFKAAKGEFIAILDDDDEFMPTKIEKQMEVMLQGGASLGVVYCWEEFWDDKADRFIKIGMETARGDLYQQLLRGPCTAGGTNMLIRKSAIEKAGGYDDSIAFGSDFQFNLNISKYFKHDFVPEVLVKTHWNHEYVHLTTQPGGNVNYVSVIEYYQKILSDHIDGFDRLPESRLWYYKSIISAASNLQNYGLVFKYLILGIKTGGINFKKIKFIYDTVKRLVVSIFSKK